MKKKSIFILFVFTVIAFYCSWYVFKFTAERNVEHYLSNLSTDGLTEIGIYGFGKRVKICTIEDQEEILNHLSKIEADMGNEGSDTNALGGIILDIKLFYSNGNEESITLPAFTYPTLLGCQDFYLSIKGEDIWEPFAQYFELLRD